MEFIPMIFSVMCVSLWSGGEDCSYLYTNAPYSQVLTMWYSAGGSEPEHYLYGFTYHEDKKIYMTSGFSAVDIGHEAKHVICNLEYEKSGGINHSNCTGHFEKTKQ
jgi:hypothetical protein